MRLYRIVVDILELLSQKRRRKDILGLVFMLPHDVFFFSPWGYSRRTKRKRSLVSLDLIVAKDQIGRRLFEHAHNLAGGAIAQAA